MLILISIVFNVLLVLSFKVFDLRNINKMKAITINYFVAGSIGLIVSSEPLTLSYFTEAWLVIALVLALLFVCVLNLIGYGVREIGIASTTLSQKMSVVIPVLFGIFYFNDDLSILKIIGLLIAVLSIYLSSKKKDLLKIPSKKSVLILSGIFLGSGCIDTLLKIAEYQFIAPNQMPLFFVFIFLPAGIIGILFLKIRNELAFSTWKRRDLVGGIVLGIINYTSLHFLLRAISESGLDSSSFFPINNIGIILLSVFVAVLVFKEKLNNYKIIGLLTGILAIILIYLSNK
ncbi:MAG: multidrug transporter EmrE-like cation transporter [Sphingobacteriales bacterium]|jgi:multidrug transporter EmrE-like cation transporter